MQSSGIHDSFCPRRSRSNRAGSYAPDGGSPASAAALSAGGTGGPAAPAGGGPSAAGRADGVRKAATSRATSVARKIWPDSASMTAIARPPLVVAVKSP